MRRIAVTYDNGQVFQHFGHTEAFKIYEVEGDEVVNSEVIASNGVGHGALAGLLSDHTIDVLICGGIGEYFNIDFSHFLISSPYFFSIALNLHDAMHMPHLMHFS